MEWSNLAKLVYRRTYSRADNGRNELWEDTVRRVIRGNLRGIDPRFILPNEPERLEYFLTNRKAGPAGRGLWFSGTVAHERIGGVALNNCFVGTEHLLTKEYGSVQLVDVIGRLVSVWTRGGWKQAVVARFGRQKVQRITFVPVVAGASFCNYSVEVTATPDHRWFLIDGSETINLKKGDVVPASCVSHWDENSSDYQDGIRHGVIFGCGTLNGVIVNGMRQYQICCQEQNFRLKYYMNLFDNVSFSDGDTKNIIGWWSATDDLQQFPSSGKNCDYLRGFLRGWLDVSGMFFPRMCSVRCAKVGAKEWLLRNAAMAGFVLVDCIKTDFFVLALLESDVQWVVDKIEELGEQDTFCAIVPDGHAFTLSSGIYTSNCWFMAFDDWHNFVITQDLLMLGGGVGASVEHKYVSKLPRVKKNVCITHRLTKDADFIVPDSREGWCELMHRVFESFFVTGKSFTFSTICLRGAGEPIYGFGGKASGPLPLVKCVENICQIMRVREGRHLRPIDVGDLICSIAEMVVAGNVRRSAIILIGDCFDKDFLKAKRWDLGIIPKERRNANYSVICDDVDDLHPLFWKSYQIGEPYGIVNRKNIQQYGRMGELKRDTAEGVNPCAEATLEPFEPCNLQEIALPNLKDEDEFIEAAILMHRWGKRVTMEHYHHPEIAEVIRRNRRVGTGITGCLQSNLFNPATLDKVYRIIQEENIRYSAQLGIPESIRTTTVKPSGTVGKMFDCLPGIHPAYSQYMIQRIRLSAGDPLIPILRNAGHSIEPELRFDGSRDSGTLVVEFPVAWPDGTPCADNGFDTWKQLDVVLMAQKYWSDQAVSVTVYYKREDVPQLKEWLANNLQYIKTISFLCHQGHGFAQAPMEPISREQYEKMASQIQPIDFSDISSGDLESMECSSGRCPIK